MIKSLVTIAFIYFCLVFGISFPKSAPSTFAIPATQKARGSIKMREPNLYAPDLYAEKLDFVATLQELPGFKKKTSYWELSYQLYFIPEQKYYEALEKLPRGPSNPTPEQFPGRILLAEGHKKISRLATLEDRTISLKAIRFKEKVPDAQRTKFSYLMTGYSVKIFDAELDTTIYHSGIFLAEPFVANSDNQPAAIARKAIYLNFGVNPNGTLNRSRLAPGESFRK